MPSLVRSQQAQWLRVPDQEPPLVAWARAQGIRAQAPTAASPVVTDEAEPQADTPTWPEPLEFLRSHVYYAMILVHWLQGHLTSIDTSAAETESASQRWQHPGAAIGVLSPSQTRLLKFLYVFRTPQRVSLFLSDHPFLVPLLLEAPAEIEACFPGHQQLALEVLTDPEETDDTQLVLFIQTDLPPPEAVARLHRLDRNWWLEASRASRGKLCIHVE